MEKLYGLYLIFFSIPVENSESCVSLFHLVGFFFSILTPVNVRETLANLSKNVLCFHCKVFSVL